MKLYSYFFKRFLKNHQANVVIEFALALPITIVILAGVFELTMYSLLHNKMTRIAGTISHVVSLQNLSRDKLIAIMNTGDILAEPFDFEANGSVIVSQVRNEGETNDPVNMVISWQENQGSQASRIGAAGGIPGNLPGDISVINDQTMIITEVLYSFEPLIFGNFFLESRMLYKTATYVPRLGKMNTLLGEGG